jgi:8-oxo-dGTP pyrophosphatase MutT (NUDIX family)
VSEPPARDAAPPTWLAAGARELAPVADLAVARATVERYAPRDAEQAEARRFVLAWIDAHPDALLRSCLEGHLTSSALVLDHAGERALLTLHAKLGRWLQLGGHCDGDANLAGSALREATEESGIAGLAIDPEPLEHWHLDVRYVVRAPESAEPRISAESKALRWFAPDELARIETDASVRRLFALALGE